MAEICCWKFGLLNVIYPCSILLYMYFVLQDFLDQCQWQQLWHCSNFFQFRHFKMVHAVKNSNCVLHGLGMKFESSQTIRDNETLHMQVSIYQYSEGHDISLPKALCSPPQSLHRVEFLEKNLIVISMTVILKQTCTRM